MKKIFSLLIVATCCVLSSARGQSFQNLGFESATIVPFSSGVFTWAEWNPAMPGWIGYLGANQVNSLFYNDQCLSACTSLAIIDQPGFTFGAPLLGRYSAILSAGVDLDGRYEASIAQTGLIPSDAKSVRFLGSFSGTGLSVSVSGETLPLYSLNQTANFTVYGADISQFAGQVGELRFTVATDQATARQGGGGRLVLDFISFSATPVPEPQAFVLLLLGGVILFYCKIRAGIARL
jgi:hypothetical protein